MLSNIPPARGLPKPVTVHPYFDKLAIWLPRPEPKWLIRQTAEGSGHLRISNGAARFNRAFRQRIEVKQPTERFLHWLAQHEDGLVNAAEVALDLTFGHWIQRDEAFELVDWSLVRRWHGQKQRVRLYRRDKDGKRVEVQEAMDAQSRYDGPRTAPNILFPYKQNHDRFTGELCHLLHMEWRAKGASAVRSIGIESPVDLLDFDFRQFWAERLLLFDVDEGKVGRLLRNNRQGGRSRTTTFLDQRLGGAMVRGSWSVQQFLDRFRPWKFRVERALVPIDSTDWLPQGCGDRRRVGDLGWYITENDHAAAEHAV
jgi:hypothetical protein